MVHNKNNIILQNKKLRDGVNKEVENVIYGNNYTITEENQIRIMCLLWKDRGKVTVNKKNQLVEVVNSKASGLLAVNKKMLKI